MDKITTKQKKIIESIVSIPQIKEDHVYIDKKIFGGISQITVSRVIDNLIDEKILEEGKRDGVRKTYKLIKEPVIAAQDSTTLPESQERRGKLPKSLNNLILAAEESYKKKDLNILTKYVEKGGLTEEFLEFARVLYKEIAKELPPTLPF